MSKFGCTCGHVIVDQTDHLAFKATLLRDQDEDAYWAPLDRVAEFLTAVRDGRREAWIADHFLSRYPVDTADADVIHDILLVARARCATGVYECQACGRLWVERAGRGNAWVSYTPDSGRVEGVLEGERVAGT